MPQFHQRHHHDQLTRLIMVRLSLLIFQYSILKSPFFYLHTGAKRVAPSRPREQPPSLPRSPSPLGSMSSLHDVLKVCYTQSFWKKVQI